MAKRSSTKKKTVSGKRKAGKKKASNRKAVKKTAAKKAAGAKKAAKKPRARATATIPPDSPDYPPYILTFEGSLIPDPPLTVRGVHTNRFAGPPAVTLDVTHNETDFGIPNLTFRFNRE